MMFRAFIVCILFALGVCANTVASETFVTENLDNVALVNQAPLADVFIELSLKPEQAVVGELRTLHVDIISRTWLRRAPKYPDIKVPGAIVVSPKSFGLNSNRDIAGVEYTVQSQEYQIYPQRAGAFRVPSIKLSLAVAGNDGVSSESFTIHSSPTTFVATAIPALAEAASTSNAEQVLAASEVTLDERYTAPSQTGGGEEGLKVAAGDVLIRELELKAESTLAMLLPNLKTLAASSKEGVVENNDREYDPAIEAGSEVERIVGGKVYRRLLAVEDFSNRGQRSATRKERWQYVFSAAGQYELPALQLNYWDVAAGAWKHQELPSLLIEVTAAGELAGLLEDGAAANGPWPGGSLLLWITYLGIGLVITALFLMRKKMTMPRWLSRLYGRIFAQRKLSVQAQERAAWKRLTAAVNAAPTKQIISDYYQWCRFWPNQDQFTATDNMRALIAEQYASREDDSKTLSAAERRNLTEALHGCRKQAFAVSHGFTWFVSKLYSSQQLELAPLNPAASNAGLDATTTTTTTTTHELLDRKPAR